MDGLEEIQKIINNFIDESKQAKQKISQIENERNILAQNRNQKKDANSNEYEAEINMLGKQIAELGNQSQELQNKLDAKYIDVKKVVNLMVDNLIAEGIRKARKLDEHIEELQEKVTIQKERKAKYEIQKQEFYERFGRVPEVSQEAKQEDEIQDRQCEIYNNKIQQLAEDIENQEVQLTELVNLKNNFRNKEWKQEVKQNIEEIEEVEEETAVLPFIEEINVEEMEPIEEIQVEKFEPIEEVNVPEFEPIEEIRIPEFEQEEINKPELIQKETEKNQSEIDEIEKLAKAIVEQIVEEQTQNNDIHGYLWYEILKFFVRHIFDDRAFTGFRHIFQNSDSFCNGRCCYFVIARNHDWLDSCLDTFYNCIFRLHSRRIHHGNQSQECQVIFII